MARKSVSYECDLDLTATSIDPPFIFSLAGIDELTIETSSFSATAWTASTIKFEVTNDPGRGNWKDPATGAVSFTSASIAVVSVTAYRFGRLRCSAGAASAFKAHCDLYGEGGS